VPDVVGALVGIGTEGLEESVDLHPISMSETKLDIEGFVSGPRAQKNLSSVDFELLPIGGMKCDKNTLLLYLQLTIKHHDATTATSH
jgi:hypothetical protein